MEVEVAGPPVEWSELIYDLLLGELPSPYSEAIRPPVRGKTVTLGDFIVDLSGADPGRTRGCPNKLAASWTR